LISNFFLFCPFKDLLQRPSTKIIGGFVVPENSIHFKFTVKVNLYINKTKSSKCGGSLISPNYVLTAAHCVDKKLIPWKHVRVIQHDPRSKRDNIFEISNTLVHPEFKNQFGILQNDFAILKLATPVKSSSKPFFVCLPKDDLDQHAGANLTISGWGKTIPTAKNGSNVLKSAFVKAMQNSECSSIAEKYFNMVIDENYPGSPHIPVSVPPYIICVDGRLSQSSPCHGDSGGLLICLVV
jgi:secreted trypsin-like serine protease